MSRPTARLSGLAGILVAGTMTLTACGDAATSGNKSGGGGSANSASPEEQVTDADLAFARGMLPHYEQAVEMAQLAEGRTENAGVLDLAGRIEQAQEPEIETLTGWLEEWDADAGGHGGGHGSGSHSGGHSAGGHADGIMTEEDMAALEAASGADFDRRFLEMMIEHHRGAVAMANTEFAEGQHPGAVQMARDIERTQNEEIAEMQQLLGG